MNIAITPEKLDPATLPLAGRHLIEASAGTGKTYNITRLYLRLLLEKELTVQQILVMTFTKAATEELRARIDFELRNALNHWGQLGKSDPFFAVVEQQYSFEQAYQRLKPALLDLDEAAIFTIHGFCNRVLTQQAFNSGMAMEMAMEADTSEIQLEAVRDWLRQVSQNEDSYRLLMENAWHTPSGFVEQFMRPLSSNNEVSTPSEQSLQQQCDETKQALLSGFNHQKNEILQTLQAEQATIFTHLIDKKKSQAQEHQQRLDEWQALLAWLQLSDQTPSPAAVGDFINGNRYRGNEAIKTLFAPLKQLRDNFKKQLSACDSVLKKQLAKVEVYQLVVQGIQYIRQRFIEAKQQQAMMDYDDLISLLSHRVQADDGQELVAAMQQQYPVALVDEFQDTDPHQYGILDKVYPKSSNKLALLMIGDPKQAIYGFRGGDIFTYLAARDGADYQWHMDTNWRSVADVVQGYNRLFWGQALSKTPALDLFAYGISYEQIKATANAKANVQPLIDTNSDYSAINYLFLAEAYKPTGKNGSSTAVDLQQAMALSCVAEITRLLAEVKLGKALIKQQDIAILVKRGLEAKMMRQALKNANLPSVYLSNKENIYHSAEANEILLVLEGIVECENDALLTAALSTRLMRGDLSKLISYKDVDNELAWEDAQTQAIEFRRIWQQQGVMSLLLRLIHHHFLPDPEQHERALTNMIHLAELLQQASRQHKHPLQLLKWFRGQCEQSSGNDEAQVRLESDANLIRIVTMHGSKGLEYPVVFIPFASHYRNPAMFAQQYINYYSYQDPNSQQACHQVGQSDNAIRCTVQEGHAESLRLLYVAVTRASHRCYLGVAPFKDSQHSALGLALKLESHHDWAMALQRVVSESLGSAAFIALEQPKDPLPFTPYTDELVDDKVQRTAFTAKMADKWSLSSFSALIRNAQQVRFEQKDRLDQDNSIEDLSETPIQTAIDVQAMPLRFSLKKGVDAGNLLHDILENVDFSQPKWQQAFELPLQRFGLLAATQSSHEIKVQELSDWLTEVLQTQLPAINAKQDACCLGDLAWSQTLRETEFYFPMQTLSLNKLTQCLAQHRGGAGNMYLPGEQTLFGMMHGYIDLIFEHDGRFFVVDYKSTHLGDEPNQYHLEAMRENNQQHYYDLQYLIYSLAMHRYLSHRLPDYDPELHFGGVYYLYLRGMQNNNDNVDNNNDALGVFHTPISTELLSDLDAAFNANDNELEAGKNGL